MTADISTLYHAIAAVALQCAGGGGLMFGDWLTGGALCCLWFIAREHTQAEYRWIAQLGNGKKPTCHGVEDSTHERGTLPMCLTS